MSKAKALIEQAKEINAKVKEVVEGCSEAEWRLPVAGEDNRPVGVVFHHIAIAYPFALNLAKTIANEEPLPPIMSSMDNIHEFNAKHAQEQANTTKGETIAFLQQVTEETAASLQHLSDEQLNRTVAMPVMGGQEVSAEWIMTTFAIDHAKGHLATITAALEEA